MPRDVTSGPNSRRVAVGRRNRRRRLDKVGTNQQNEFLRLLPKPLYRHDIKGPQNDSPKLLDGGLFAYVMGTDPEVVLVLEAVGSPENPVWQYEERRGRKSWRRS